MSGFAMGDALKARHAQIAAKPLAETCAGHLSHDEVASKVRMLMRHDLDHEAVCTMGRDRIVWLAGALSELSEAAKHVRDNVRDDTPEMWERLDAALAKAGAA